MLLITNNGVCICMCVCLVYYSCLYDSWKPIIDYINEQYNAYLRDESGLNRRNIEDHRVHCCLYFISPTGHGYVIVVITLLFCDNLRTPRGLVKIHLVDCTPLLIPKSLGSVHFWKK